MVTLVRNQTSGWPVILGAFHSSTNKRKGKPDGSVGPTLTARADPVPDLLAVAAIKTGLKFGVR